MLLILVQRPFVQFSTLHIIEYHYLDYISIVLLDCFAIFLDFSESFPDAIVAALQSFLKAPSSPLIVRAKYTYVTYPLSHFLHMIIQWSVAYVKCLEFFVTVIVSATLNGRVGPDLLLT